MMEVLRFVFQSGWHFFGTLLLMAVFLNGIAEIVLAFKGIKE